MKPQQPPSAQEVLAGLVERVTFHNGENGFGDIVPTWVGSIESSLKCCAGPICSMVVPLARDELVAH